MTAPSARLRWLGAALLVLGFGISSAVAQGYPPPQPGPPAAPTEVVPVAPPGYWVWQPGSWRWNGVQYVWVPGRYVHPHPHRVHWIEAHWAIRHGAWVWVPARWG